MGYLEGLLGGFLGRKSEIEQQNLEEAQRSQQREAAVFNTLINSPDPEIKSLAVTGLLHAAEPNKRKSGLSGWLGEMQASPYLPQIQALINTPVEETHQIPGITSRTMTPESASRMIPGATPAAQPTTSPTQAGSAPMAPAVATPPPTFTPWETSPARTETTSRPRQVFPNAGDVAREQAAGQYGGRAQGLMDALRNAKTPEERQIVLELSGFSGGGAGGGAGSLMPMQGQMPDGSIVWGISDRRPGSPTFGHFLNPDTQQPLQGFAPRTTTASVSMGQDLEAISRELGYGSASQALMHPEQAAHIRAREAQLKGQLTYKDALTFAHQMRPAATIDEALALADGLLTGTAAPVPTAAGAVGAPPPQGAGATTTPTPASAVPAVPVASGAPPQAAGGARKAIEANLPAGAAQATKETGAPLPPLVQQAFARAKSTNDLIDQALVALAPFRNDNSPEGSLKLAASYRQGVYEPAAAAAAQLADLAGLQSSAQGQLTAGASRALKFYTDRRQHVPRLPSSRQVEFYQMGGSSRGAASAIGTVSRLIKSDEGGFDSPKLMYEKLQTARANNQNFIKELEAAGSTAPGAAVGTAPPGSNQPYQDTSGNWIVP
jgi:hypothetical protein